MESYRQFCREKPLSAWLQFLVFLLGLTLTVHQFRGFQNSQTTFMIFAIGSANPTLSLLRRFSKEELQLSPLWAEEQKAGTLSLVMAVSSIVSFLVAFYLLSHHVVLPDSLRPVVVLSFPLSLILSFVLAYAERCSKPGRYGLVLAAGWLLVLMIALIASSSRS